MFCNNYGKEISDDAAFCSGCGIAVVNTAAEAEVHLKQKGRRGMLILTAAVLALLVIVSGLVLGIARSPERKIAEHMKRAERYLDKEDDDKAIAEYKEVLK